tara:strand:+ start:182 stop:361 length:180 start_codon:yes stop_codon:yes gene_type:complete
MTDEDWENLEDIQNDFEKLRCGNVDANDKELIQEHIENRMRCYAKYSGHLNWKVLNYLL